MRPLEIEFNGRTKAGIVVATLAAVYVADFLAERRKTTPIWKYRSFPPHPLEWDRSFRVLSSPVMKLVADGMIMHQWDAKEQPIDENYVGWVMPGDLNAKPRRNLLEAAIVDTRFGWQTVYKMGLNQGSDHRLPELWQVAYAPLGGNTGQRCRIAIPQREQILMLAGDQPYKFFALDLEGNELPLIANGPYHRRSQEIKGKRLF